MFVRWKRKKLRRCEPNEMFHVSLTAELCSSFRENGKTKQKYIATLGNVREVQIFTDSFNGYVWDYTKIKYHISFWTSAWKKLYELGIEGEELEKIETQILKTVQSSKYCTWYPPTYESSGHWEHYLMKYRGIWR